MPRSPVFSIFVAGACLAGSAALAAPPELVSPVGLVELRCPTFSWSSVDGAAGYELLVYAVSGEAEVGAEPLLSARLPGGASSWTPSGRSCLAAGGRYTWSLRVLGQEEARSWSEPALFEVVAAPSLGEVEAAIATLRRYLAAGGEEKVGVRGERGEAAAAGDGSSGGPSGRRSTDSVGAGLAPARAAARAATTPRSLASPRPPGAGAPLSAASEGLESVSAASVPSLGSPSLTVDANLALGAASNVFKAGSVFLWDDTTGNTALGRLALASATGTTTNNTAIGRLALSNTIAGGSAVYGSYNTALGDQALFNNTTGHGNTASGSFALFSNTTGFRNTASGFAALFSNTTGAFNTASGDSALFSNSTGSFNTASGYRALVSNTIGSVNTASGYRALSSNTTGYRNTAVGPFAGDAATTGNDNIFLGAGASGVAGEGNTIRIGGATGTGFNQQNRTFIAGIRDITTFNANAVNVLIDSAGQLGTASSSRALKQDIREIGELSRRLLELRPVAFRYRQHAALDPETPLQFGLVAEEVAAVFPELVVLDEQGRPETVKYHLLAALLLNELQNEHRENVAQHEELAALEKRLAVLEESRDWPKDRRAWFRRRE